MRRAEVLGPKRSSRRALLALALAAPFGTTRQASAHAQSPLLLEQLLSYSQRIVIAMPVSAHSRWEGEGQDRRIISYTTLEVLQSLRDGESFEPQIVVRTLGGRVGGIGQVVHGEAKLDVGKESVCFLREHRSGLLQVTGMAQGYYPIDWDGDGIARLRATVAARHAAKFDPDAAVTRLHGQQLSECERWVTEQGAQ